MANPAKLGRLVFGDGSNLVCVQRSYCKVYKIAGLAMKRWKQHILLAMIFIAVIYGRIDPVIITSGEITTPAVRPGDHIVVNRDGKWIRPDCISVSVTSYASDSLHPPRDHPLGHIDLGVPILNRTRIVRSWQIPFDMPWGQAIHKATLSFSCFPFFDLWPIKVPLKELPFMVVPRDQVAR